MLLVKYVIQGPLAKFVDWQQCAAAMQREAVTVMPSCSGGGNIVMVVILKEPFSGWWSNYEGRLKSSWTGGSAPLLCRERQNNITAAHCLQSTNFSNGPRILVSE
jgi:hypothetical protein